MIAFIGLAVGSALLLFLAFPPAGWGWLSWFSLCPLYWAVSQVKTPRQAAVLCGLCGFLLYGVSLHWLWRLFSGMTVGLWSLLALFWALWGYGASWLLARVGVRKAATTGGRLVVALGWAVLWAGIEVFRSEVWPLQFSWFALGYAHWKEFPTSLLQGASLWGVYGNSFWIAWVNALLALGWCGRWSLPETQTRVPVSQPPSLSAILGLLILGGVSMLCHSLRRPPVHGGRPVSVAAVQNESYQPEQLFAASQSLRGVQLLVWPEYQVLILPGQGPSFEQRFRSLARQLKTVLVVGCAEFLGTQGEDSRKRAINFAWVFGPEGIPLGRYQKQHPIPLVEQMFIEPGRSSPVFPTEFGKLGVAICYDLDFTDTARRLCQNGAEVLAVPNLDPAAWGGWQHIQHSAMAPVRAVEARRWIVRAASSGFSQIIDPFGEVHHQLGFAEARSLVGTVRLSARPPLSWYHRWGWLCPYLLVAGAALILGSTVAPRVVHRLKKVN